MNNKRGKRGSKTSSKYLFNRSLEKEASKLIHKGSTTNDVLEAAKYCESYTIIDDYTHKEAHVVDKSLSTKQHLKAFGMKRLLKQGNPFSPAKIVRESSKTHKITVDKKAGE